MSKKDRFAAAKPMSSSPSQLDPNLAALQGGTTPMESPKNTTDSSEDAKLTRDQKRAKTALKHVLKLKEDYKDDKDFYKDYGRMAHKLPILIRTAGLAQALAFVEARGKDGHKKLLDDLSSNVKHGNILGINDNLVVKSHSTEKLSEYMQLTNEVLACCLWYKRCAQSVLKIEAGDSNDQT